MTETNTQVLLARRPRGWVRESDFLVVQTPLPQPGPGEFLVRNQYLSLDPYLRGRMNDVASYVPPVAIGQVMAGGTVGDVVASQHPGFSVGDTVVAQLGWQEYATSDGNQVRKIAPSLLPPSAYLGVLGMPGVTAWIGLLDIGTPRRNETVVVSAAAGAVGSVVGQLAKQHGCRAVGIAGGPAKCAYVVHELGFDACVDYKAASFGHDLRAAAPTGIDVYFDNVGGDVLDTVVEQLAPFARIVLCGLISQYNEATPRGLQNLGALLGKRVRLQGFIVSDYLDRWPAAIDALARGVTAGTITYRETIADGLANAPSAFVGLLKGQNIGKQLVTLR